MEQTRRIVVCGRSLFAMIVETSLTKLPAMDIVRLDPRLPGAEERIAALEPDIVMIERDSGQSDLAMALLGRGIALVELDIERKQATALTGRQVPAVGVADLARMIEQVSQDARGKMQDAGCEKR